MAENLLKVSFEGIDIAGRTNKKPTMQRTVIVREG